MCIHYANIRSENHFHRYIILFILPVHSVSRLINIKNTLTVIRNHIVDYTKKSGMRAKRLSDA